MYQGQGSRKISIIRDDLEGPLKYYPRVFSQSDSFGRLHSPNEIIGKIDVGYAKAFWTQKAVVQYKQITVSIKLQIDNALYLFTTILLWFDYVGI